MAAIFVGDLHPEVTEVLLLHRFSPSGRVQSVHICRDRKSGSSLGYAYINYQHRADAERALDMFNYELLLGKPMRVMWSRYEASAKFNNMSNIFLKNLDPSIDDLALFDTFSVFGRIVSCKVVSSDTGSTGHGYIQFESAESAELAIKQLDGKLLNDHQVTIEHFKSHKQREAEACRKWDEEREQEHVERQTEVCQKTKQGVYLYIKNLDENIDDKCLHTVFSNFGTVMKAKVIMENGCSCGFGFVWFPSPQEAMVAKKRMNGKILGKKPVYVGVAIRRGERQAQPAQQPMQPPCLSDNTVPEVESLDSVPAAKPVRPVDSVPVRRALSVYSVPDLKTAPIIDTVPNQEVTPTLDIVPDTKTDPSVYSVPDTETAQSKDTFTDTKTAQSKDTFTDTKTAQSRDTFTDTKTAQSKDTFTDTKTAQSRDTFTDTKTAQSRDTVKDTKTAQSKDTFTDTKTAQSKDTFTDTKTAQSKDTFTDTKTDQSKDTFTDTETAPAVDMNLRKVLSTNIQNPEASCIDVQLDAEDELKFPPRERLTIYILESVPVDEQIRIAYDYMLPLVERIHPAQANDITWMLLEGNNNYEIINMIGDPEHLQAQVDEMDALLKARKAGLKPEILRRMFNNCSNKKRRKKGKNKRQI